MTKLITKLLVLSIALSITPLANSMEKLNKQSLEKSWDGNYVLVKRKENGKTICLKMEKNTLSVINHKSDPFCNNEKIQDAWVKENGALCLRSIQNSKDCRKIRKTEDNKFYFGKKLRPILTLKNNTPFLNPSFEEFIELLLKKTINEVDSGKNPDLSKIKSLARDFNHAYSQYELGAIALFTKDHKMAFKWFSMAAEQGFAEAQFNLGWMYDQDVGVQQDYKQAAKWYTKAAEQGLAIAQYGLGLIYKNGKGVPQDYKEAMHWYRKAGDQGMAKAQTNLGSIYDGGIGVPQDYKEAMHWYRKAAEQGNAVAQHNLAVMYLIGKGVPQDYKEVFKWSSKAAEQGYAAAQYNMGLMYAQGDGVIKDLSKAKYWIRKVYQNPLSETYNREQAIKAWDQFKLGKY